MEKFHSSLAWLKPESFWNLPPNPVSFPPGSRCLDPGFPHGVKDLEQSLQGGVSWVIPKENPAFTPENRDEGAGPQSQFPGKAEVGL